MMLERPDRLVAMRPDVLADEARRQFLLRQQVRMHAHDQHFLIVGAVEDADAASPRQPQGGAAQEIILQLFFARRLERMHLAALRIDAGHHVLDDAVLARGIHALQHDQHRPLALGVQHLLLFREPREALGEHRFHAVLVDGKAEILCRVVIAEPEMFRLVDPATLDEFWRASSLPSHAWAPSAPVGRALGHATCRPLCKAKGAGARQSAHRDQA